MAKRAGFIGGPRRHGGSSRSSKAAAGGGAKITFTDTFTGTNGDAPNGRWSPAAGWTIQSNTLSFGGGAFGGLWATCTAGNNDFTVSMTQCGGFAYPYFYIRYVDAQNYVAFMRDDSDSSKFKIIKYVSNVRTDVDTDITAAAIGGGGTVRVTSVGNTITGYVGGAQVCTGTVAEHSAATQIGLGINTGHSTDCFDNAILA
jgi:hypothetical protein